LHDRIQKMSKTVRVRDIDDDVYLALVRRAAEVGVTVPELLRREITRLTARPSLEEWLERTRGRPSDITREEVLATFDEHRGPWPDDDR
jgi:antitoxin FitA